MLATGRISLMRTWVMGGTTYFLRTSDFSTLWEDIALIRPTFMLLIPRVANMIYDRYQARFEELAAASPQEEEEQENVGIPVPSLAVAI